MTWELEPGFKVDTMVDRIESWLVGKLFNSTLPPVGATEYVVLASLIAELG